MPDVSYTRTEPHELVVHVYLTSPDEPTSRDSSFCVLTRAWVWAHGQGARRIPDNRLMIRGTVPAVEGPLERSEVAEALRAVAHRLEHPA